MNEQILKYLEDYLETLAPANAASEPAKAGYRHELQTLIDKVRSGR